VGGSSVRGVRVVGSARGGAGGGGCEGTWGVGRVTATININITIITIAIAIVIIVVVVVVVVVVCGGNRVFL
jgi:hypothetical protein